MNFNSKKKKEKKSGVFRQEAYIPKKRLQKKERSLSGYHQGKSLPNKGRGRKVLILLLWLLFLAEMFYILFFSNFFAVQAITIQRESEEGQISDDALKNFLRTSWQGEWMPKAAKNNLLLLFPQNITNDIKHRFPKIATIEVVRKFPDTLSLSLAEKPYQVLWCKKENCFLIDDQGRLQDATIFFQHPDEQGPAIRIQDRAEKEVNIGSYVLDETEREFVNALHEKYALRTGFQNFSVLEKPYLQASEFHLKTEKDFTLYFDSRLPVDGVLNNLMLLLEKEIPEDEWNKIDYIDLRTENRIYYTREDRAPEKTEEQKKREEEEEKKREEEENKN